VGLCEPWITGSEVKLRPGMDDVDDLLADLAAAQASSMLFFLSGRKYPGKCTTTVRPAARPVGWDDSRWVDQMAMWGFPMGFSSTWGVCRIAHNDFGFCAQARRIDLVHFPVRDVTEVSISGQSVSASSYRLDNFRTLTRIDGGMWPTCQRLDEPDDGPNVFTVTYEFGEDPPDNGIEAATTLAAELAKYHANKPHKLPSRITSVVRQDVTMAVIDPMQFMGKKGDLPLTGIWEVDLFVRTHNPSGSKLPPVVWSPDRPPPYTTGTTYRTSI
jgi:hypothetical protein